MRILLVEDDPILGRTVAEELEEAGYAVDWVVDGEAALATMAKGTFDGVILDENIPPPTGLDLLRAWRAEGTAIPVLMVTAKGGVGDRVEGLDSGADDYLAKPFQFPELMARVRSLLRRGDRPMNSALRAGPLSMDRPGKTVWVDGELVELSGKEFSLLEYLLARRGAVVPRSELIEHAWDSSFDSLTNVVDVLIHRLRAKLSRHTSEKLIHTVKGLGYRLESDPK